MKASRKVIELGDVLVFLRKSKEIYFHIKQLKLQ